MDSFHIFFLLVLLLVGLCDYGASSNSTRWAVLVAGSNGYFNYRHQADVCHAYQILKKNGLKDENIVVFMYDDIAHDPDNPRPGVIINSPNGTNVYKGVPKDYTGEQVTAKNLFAVILGDKKSVRGGSGKVVNSKPTDQIFIYYSDHGGAGALSMPSTPYIYANDFIRVLKKKHAMNSYNEMLIYVEACEAGSIFEGLLPSNLNIYVTTASNAVEDSWATYCPDEDPNMPSEYITCLGDLYSAAWMENSETHNLKKETVGKQYEIVRKKTYDKGDKYGRQSHVMEYGSMHIKSKPLSNFLGYNPRIKLPDQDNEHNNKPVRVVKQREADLLFYPYKYQQLADDGNQEKDNVMKELIEKMEHRAHIDRSVELIGKLIFGLENGSAIIGSPTPSGQPIVEDWSCLKSMIRLFESQCGTLTQYGMKHTRAFANICNKGVSEKRMEEACIGVCGNYNLDKWSPLIYGYSA